MVKVLKKNTGLSLKQQLELLLNSKPLKSTKRNWDKFFGKVKFSENPVEYQRKLRDE